MSGYQILPPLSNDERVALRADIQRRGIQIPILVDEHDNIIDGHHRKQIADELGIDCPVERREGLTEAGKHELAVALNIQRRHLTREQRDALIERLLKDSPDRSDVAIAKAIGTSDKTVTKKRRALESRSAIPAQTTRIDTKGRAQPARKGRSENPNVNTQSSTPTSLPPEKVIEKFKDDCGAIKQLRAAGRLTPQDAFEIATRAKSLLSYTLDVLRDAERAALVKDLSALIAEGGGVS